MTDQVGELEEKDPAELAARGSYRFAQDDSESTGDGGDITADDSGLVELSVQTDAGLASSSDDSDSDSDADDGYVTADDSKFVDPSNDSSSEDAEDSEEEDEPDSDEEDEEEETRRRRGEAEDRMRQRWMAEWRDWARDNLRSFPDLAHCDDWDWDQWDEWRSNNRQRVDTFYQTPFRDDLP